MGGVIIYDFHESNKKSKNIGGIIMAVKKVISFETIVALIRTTEKLDSLEEYYIPEKYNTLMTILDQLSEDIEEPRELLYFTMFTVKIVSTLTTSVETKELMSEHNEALARLLSEAYGRDPYQDPDQDF